MARKKEFKYSPEEITRLARFFIDLVMEAESNDLKKNTLKMILDKIDSHKRQYRKKFKQYEMACVQTKCIRDLTCYYINYKGSKHVPDRELLNFLQFDIRFSYFKDAEKIKQAITLLKRTKNDLKKDVRSAIGGEAIRRENYNTRVSKYGDRELAAANVEAVLKIDPDNSMNFISMSRSNYLKYEKIDKERDLFSHHIKYLENFNELDAAKFVLGDVLRYPLENVNEAAKALNISWETLVKEFHSHQSKATKSV